MRVRLPPYLLLLLVGCVGTEVGNPTFACGSESADGGEGVGGRGGEGSGDGGSGGSAPTLVPCSLDGSDCGLSVTVNSRGNDSTAAICPGGRGRTDLLLVNLTDRLLSGVVHWDNADVTVTPDRFTVAPHDQAVLAVVFAPGIGASDGVDGVTLQILLDGQPTGELLVPIDARIDAAAPPGFAVLCGTFAPCGILDLGEVDVGATGTATFSVVNDGCVPLDLLEPDLGADGRLVLVDPPTFPVTLAPLEFLELWVAFTPAAIGPTGGEITLRAPGGFLAVVPWQGVGR